VDDGLFSKTPRVFYVKPSARRGTLRSRPFDLLPTHRIRSPLATKRYESDRWIKLQRPGFNVIRPSPARFRINGRQTSLNPAPTRFNWSRRVRDQRSMRFSPTRAPQAAELRSGQLADEREIQPAQTLLPKIG
jgi:hypothetical protein